MPVLVRLMPYALAFTSSLCIMILELVSSRLVARHVGASLTVWTSVIGIILGGICLGNVLGGRLSDRVDPKRAVGPLFALGAVLTLVALWMNAEIGRILPRPDQMNWELRTILVVLIDFLVPATVLGMIGPVVAKIAVEQARRAGSAIGDVYFWGAVGSIVGTLFCGFKLQVWFGTTAITLLVAAGLSLLAAALMSGLFARIAAVIAALLLVLGSIGPVVERIGPEAVTVGLYRVNYLVAAGYLVALFVAAAGVGELFAARRSLDELLADEAEIPLAATSKETSAEPVDTRTGLGDLATLAFLASMVFMALEMVAGRLVTRHLGSSIYGWSSVIAVLLAGLSLGNWLGGKIANYIRNERQASWLFLVASMLTLLVIVLETPAKVHEFATKYLPSVAAWIPENSVLASAPGRTSMTLPGGYEIMLDWPYRILIVVMLVFFLPALSMGTVSPVVAKLAIDRRRRVHSTGTAIGQVYAWGMVGSILGTFLTGFVLIDFLGTKGVILALVTVLALSATFLGDLVHAVWAGIPLGLCVLAFVPPPWVGNVARFVRFLPPGIDEKSFRDLGERYGIREPEGDLATRAEAMAYADESDYYYIKIDNDPENGGELQRRTLVLDNLIHGYFMLDHPERLDYDYEHIYALVAYRAARASGKVKFKPVPAEETTGATPEASPAPPGASAPAKGKEPKAEAKPAEKPAVPPPAKPEVTPPPAKPEASTPPAKPGDAPKGGTGLRSVAPAPQQGKAKAPSPAPAPSQAPSDRTTAPAPENKGNEPPAKPGGGEKKPEANPSEGQQKPGTSESQKAPGTSESEKSPVASESQKSPVAKQPPLPTEPFKDLKSIFDVKDISGMLDSSARKRPEPYLPPVESSNLTTLFLGGGAYCFQRHMLYAYKGTSVDVAEIDPAVTRANQQGTGLADGQHHVANPIPDPAKDPASHPDKIVTYWGDARQFVELHQDHKKYDLIFGDAFNDFSVPWHLTTREFNEKIKKMLTPDGVYMINIIDVYLADDQISARADEKIEDREKDLREKIEEKWRIKAARQKLSDEEMERGAEEEIKTVVPLSREQKDQIREEWKRKARDYGGFVGSWTRTAQLTFGKDNVYVFGTSKPGSGRRETFVVVASMKPLDLKELGLRKDDPRYYTPSGKQTTPKPYEAKDLETVVESRSRGIILTDDYAPVENLLAPVAETRGERD